MTDGQPFELVSPYEPRAHFMPFHKRRQRWSIARRAPARRQDGGVHQRADHRRDQVPPQESALRLCRAATEPGQGHRLDLSQGIYDASSPARRIRKTELWVQLPGGARIRLYGADNPDRLRGLYLDGVVLDEYGDMDPTIWTKVIRPMLSDERRGWACFIGTPKGKNGFHRLWADSEGDPDWYRLELKASETKLLDAKELADARRMMSDDEYAQEYECSFDAAVRGAYYAKAIIALEAGRSAAGHQRAARSAAARCTPPGTSASPIRR